MNGISALIKETPEGSFAPSGVRGYSENVAVHEPGRASSAASEPAGDLFWTSQPPEQ